jgi:hypothetical protein
MTTEYLMAWATPAGTFIVFSTITLFGGLFCCIFMKETRGLSDVEKKELY